MERIAGSDDRVEVYDSFNRFREEFLRVFKETFCGKLRQLRKDKFWNHIALFMIE